MENIDENQLRRICKHSIVEKIKGQQAIFCKENCGNPIPYNISLPNVRENKTCVATSLYNNGHLEIKNDTEEIKKCHYNPYNKKG